MLQEEKDNLIFGLDIGTRTIIGIVGYKQEKNFVILATETMEHESRAMVDGQIHDILAVARSAKKVKEALEIKLDRPLKEVSIAAAGRVLKTMKVKVSQEFEEPQTIDSFAIKTLELQGIQEAQKQIHDANSDEPEPSYFYVGHSVINYYLNEFAIANLEEQKARQIGADILATFLPKIVVESLYTVMDKIGLKVVNMTLEPIAAMNAVIPPNLRLLNLALVDIGAGTSDIAITEQGSVTAYGMIPLAGDEVTEKIVHTYLVDFQTAENIKQQLDANNVVEFIDIIGISHRVPAKDVYAVIKDIIQKLGDEIASKIIELNGLSPPNAVFCVGGGSQTPYITEILAEKLALPIERISIRSSEHATVVIDEEKQIQGPESITPLGICITAMESKEKDFITVKVNGEAVELLNTKKITVADVVIGMGLDHSQIISARGKTLMFKLNGSRRRIKGGVGTQSYMTRNNHPVTLETPISEGDELVVYPARNGEDASITIIELIDEMGLIKEETIIKVNDLVMDWDYKVQNGDDILLQKKAEEPKQVEEPAEISKPQLAQPLEKPAPFVKKERLIYLTVNGDAISIPYKQNLVFVTIFDYIDFDLSAPKGNIVLKLNGKPASYTDILKDGDQVDVYWEQNNI